MLDGTFLGARQRARSARENRPIQDAWSRRGKRRRVHRTAARLVDALHPLRAVEARLTLAEGALLAELTHLNRYEALGFVRQGDFATEVLKLHPRTMRRRIVLHRLLEAVPELSGPFLEGRIGVSQALAFRDVVTSANASIWVRMAGRLSVRQLQSLARRVKEKRRQEETGLRAGDADDGAVCPDGDDGAENVVPRVEAGPVPEDPLEEPRRSRVSFLSPQSAAFAIEHGLETAKRVLGWEAPRDECLGAVLAEAESTLAASSKPAASRRPPSEGDPVFPDNPVLPDTRDRVSGGNDANLPDASREIPVWYHKQALKASRHLLGNIKRKLARIEALAPSSNRESLGHLSPGALVDRYLALQRQKNPVRILIARVVSHLESLGAARLLGYRNPVDLTAGLLDVTPRSARDVLDAGHALDTCPPLADALARGNIGFGQVVALGKSLGMMSVKWIRRARDVTARQFRREVRLLGRLAYAVPNRIGFDPGAFPRPELESLLRKRLFELGWVQEDLDREFEERGIQSPPEASSDPAENPALMSRLELLVDLLAIERCGREDTGLISVAGKPGMGKLLSVPGRHRRVTVWTRRQISDHWSRLREDVLSRCGDLPDWAVATLLVKAAEDEWNRIDPGRIPTESAILERDGYLCQAPGCSSRRLLEVHHIIFQSHGGPDESWNLITLCAMHHKHAVHRHTMRVTGKAPYDLTWEVGLSTGRSLARWVYRGERRAQERPASSDAPCTIDPGMHESARAMC